MMTATNDANLMNCSLTNLAIRCCWNICSIPYSVLAETVAAAMRFCTEVKVLCDICILFCRICVFLQYLMFENDKGPLIVGLNGEVNLTTLQENDVFWEYIKC